MSPKPNKAGSVQYNMCIIIKPVTYYTTAKKIYRVTNPPSLAPFTSPRSPQAL